VRVVWPRRLPVPTREDAGEMVKVVVPVSKPEPWIVGVESSWRLLVPIKVPLADIVEVVVKARGSSTLDSTFVKGCS
jgi:hypothetical protein